MMDIKQVVTKIFEDIENELSTEYVDIKFSIEFEIPEKPDFFSSYEVSGSSEIYWDSIWENDIFYRLGTEQSYMIINGVKYPIHDLDFLSSSLTGNMSGAVYDGECSCIVELPINFDTELLKDATIQINSKDLNTIETEINFVEVDGIQN